ncbi:DUF4439 domain-containing protein [Pseudarthrobacter enclensis]|uniref:DUF4439 domain-containing protein n=1 Tax=Pseudarthrobacter enclensis TaxID=993070 RepID=A0ABT9RN68_9MICC|nr:DUF4439 domain-containing protein [Pseudarthrobacter enclensis]MDP9886680.1 hypothetical protein [Pseudarthrobacter enclensis]
MKDPRQDRHPRARPFRYAVLALAALVVLSLGFALIPAEKPAPAEPPFSERARAAALAEALALRAAGMQLASTGAADPAVLDPVVTLLTIQARALLSPAAGSAPATALAWASPSSTARPISAAGFVQAMAGSGTARVRDAETADGGMARLLAGTGTAQLLAAGRLATALGVPAPQPAANSEMTSAGPATTIPCPAPSGQAAGPATAPVGSGAGLAADTRHALASAVSAEQQAVYGYQAALPRLAPAQAGPASEFLARHKELAAAAEERLRLACGTSVPQQPGYVLDPGFLAAPAMNLGRLEAATATSYGDLVAVSQGQDRAWAVSALRAAADRAVRWGADPGPVPGLALDVSQLPALPEDAGSPGGPGQAPTTGPAPSTGAGLPAGSGQTPPTAS